MTITTTHTANADAMAVVVEVSSSKKEREPSDPITPLPWLAFGWLRRERFWG